MSLAIYSEKRNSVDGSPTSVDECFSLSNGLCNYQMANYIIVVFDDLAGHVKKIVEDIKEKTFFDGSVVSSLYGAFSFLIYDKVKRQVDVFRSLTADPIFYYLSKEQLIISNKLEHLSQFSTDLDENYFRMYLHTELTETEYSPYRNINRLLPGHQLTRNKNSFFTKKYWSIRKVKKRELTLEDYIDSFKYMLEEVVQESIFNKEVIGCEVSGGLDSSSISCLAKKLKNKDSSMCGFTYLFDDINDGEFNKEKADIIYQNTDMTPTYFGLSNYWSFKNIKSGILDYDEPSSLILNYAMFRDLNLSARAQNVNVLLSGEGGDEILSTSSHYLRDLFFQGEMKQVFSHVMKMAVKRKQPIWKIIGTHIFPALLPTRSKYRVESKVNKPTWQNTGFSLNWYDTPSWIGDKLKSVTYDEVEQERKKIRDRNIESIYLQENFERLILVNPCTWLNNNIGKPLGLHRTYPFRDQRLIEFFFTLPFEVKIEMSKKKKCIREGLKNIIPKKILLKPDQSKFAEIFRKGYQKEAKFVDEIIQTSRAVEFGWIDKGALQMAVERFKYGYNNEVGLIARTLGLELWLRHHGY